MDDPIATAEDIESVSSLEQTATWEHEELAQVDLPCMQILDLGWIPNYYRLWLFHKV